MATWAAGCKPAAFGAFVGPLIAILLMWATADSFTAVFWIVVIPGFLSLGLIVFASKNRSGRRGCGVCCRLCASPS